MPETFKLKKPENYNYQKFNYFDFLRQNGFSNVEYVTTFNGDEVFFYNKGSNVKNTIVME